MKFHVFPSNNPSHPRRILLLFAGWGMDEKPFARLRHEGYDLIVIWDYRDDRFPESLSGMFDRCREIAVIAWSFGVPAAARFIAAHPELPLTARIAVNGTMHPVDDNLGIPHGIFSATLEGLSEKSLSKFNLRMCGSADRFREFAETAPQRPVGELREELSAVAKSADGDTTPATVVWDCAIVSTADRIIPPANQINAWQHTGEAMETVSTDWPHLPDFQAIVDRFITEKGRVAEKFGRAVETYDDNAVVQRAIAEKLCGLAARTTHSEILEIGCGTGLTTAMIARQLRPQRIIAWDLHIAAGFPRQIDGTAVSTLECDAETAIMKLESGSIGMIFSASTVQWFNSMPEFLRQIERVLRPGGTAALSTFGPETMREIRTMLPYAAHYPTSESLRRMIPAGLRLLHFEEEIRPVSFPSSMEALRHVKLTGVNALSGNHSNSSTRNLLRSYPTAVDGRAELTYNPIYITLQKPFSE